MIRRFVLLVLATACSSAPAPNVVPPSDPVVTAESIVPVRIAPNEVPVAPGDCPEALRRAAAKPDLAVDVIPSPVARKPAPLLKAPRTAFRKDGSSEVKVDVLIDTLGKADLSTFTIVTSSSPWLAANIKSVIGKWTFAPAQLAGCKVPRIYHFMASTPPTKKA